MTSQRKATCSSRNRREGNVTASAPWCRFRLVKRRRRPPPADPALLEIFAAANAMTASGQEPRKHHVVPRFYLDRWAEDGRVCVTDLDAHKSHETDPKNALIENDFYRVPAGTALGSDSPVVWEAWLSKVEGNAASVFDKLDRDGFVALDDEDLSRLAFFVAVQTTRSRWHRFQGRWMASVGIYRAMELDRPGAVETQLRALGEDPTPEHVAEVEAYWAKVLADPWQMNLSASFEMDTAQRAAGDLADLLVKRRWAVYESDKALITCDEPVVSLWEHMGAGGYFGTPIIVFPLGPHQILAMFRDNMPVLHNPETPLDWRASLDLNQTIAGNAFRNIVSQPSNRAAPKLYVPDSKEPTQLQNAGKNGNQELVRWRVMRRWSDEHDAPQRPVRSWWPPIVPPAPSPPRTREEWADERRRWDAR